MKDDWAVERKTAARLVLEVVVAGACDLRKPAEFSSERGPLTWEENFQWACHSNESKPYV